MTAHRHNCSNPQIREHHAGTFLPGMSVTSSFALARAHLNLWLIELDHGLSIHQYWQLLDFPSSLLHPPSSLKLGRYWPLDRLSYLPLSQARGLTVLRYPSAVTYNSNPSATSCHWGHQSRRSIASHQRRLLTLSKTLTRCARIWTWRPRLLYCRIKRRVNIRAQRWHHLQPWMHFQCVSLTNA